MDAWTTLVPEDYYQIHPHRANKEVKHHNNIDHGFYASDPHDTISQAHNIHTGRTFLMANFFRIVFCKYGAVVAAMCLSMRSTESDRPPAFDADASTDASDDGYAPL
jgi:hypothetical protein